MINVTEQMGRKIYKLFVTGTSDFIGISIWYRTRCCAISKVIYMNEKKQIYLTNKTFLIDHRWEGSNMANKYQIFLNVT